jgi:hypothetical protein
MKETLLIIGVLATMLIASLVIIGIVPLITEFIL